MTVTVRRISPTRLFASLVGAAALLMTGLVAAPQQAAAAADSTVTVPSSPGSSPVVTWSGHAPFNNDSAGILLGDPLDKCSLDNAEFTTQHTVQVTFPSTIDASYDTLVRFSIRWENTIGDNTTQDLAMLLYGPDRKLVAASDGSQPSEGINVTDRVSGLYTVLVCGFQNPPTGTDYDGAVVARTLKQAPAPALSPVAAPTYRQYLAPKGVATNAGEPSIGNNWKTGATLYTANTDLYKVDFDDDAGTSTWKLVNDDLPDASNKFTFDPIGFTDHITGRTLISQLYLACSGAAYSDDDFATQSTPSEGCGTGVNGFDHQTFGGGRYPEGALAVPVGYPHAVYYCAQGQALLLGGATCARSDNGGVSFGPPVQTWSTECSGIHGHVQVAPNDGTVYLPNAVCGDRQGLAVSTDAGMTWTVRTIPDSLASNNDPFVGVGSDGTLYFSYSDGTGHARIAISRDRGLTWGKSVDVGVPFGIRNSEFAMVVAGDGDRAAVAFLGTTTPGSTQAASFGKNADGDVFTGAEWHMYVATTYDRGASWVTVDATPKDPVQRGCIWNGGGGNPCRNLLDFNALTIDKTGRVMVGFADGCVSPDVQNGNDCVDSKEVADNRLVNHGAIIRQTGGKTLFKAFDQPGSTPAAAPVNKPTAARPNGGNLAATGGTPALALVGLLTVTLLFVVHRRRLARS